MEPFLQTGKIVATHGVHGDVRIDAWCDTPQVLMALRTLYLKEPSGYVPLTLTKATLHKQMVLAHFADCDTLNQALLYKNRIVYADRKDLPLPKGGFFIADLIGLPVIDAVTHLCYGTVADLTHGAANDLYEIQTPNGIVYMPAVSAFVKAVDLEKGIFVTPIPGLFDERNQKQEESPHAL